MVCLWVISDCAGGSVERVLIFPHSPGVPGVVERPSEALHWRKGVYVAVNVAFHKQADTYHLFAAKLTSWLI